MVFSDSQFLNYYSDISHPELSKLLLFGFWTFPMQNALLINQGEDIILGTYFAIYDYSKRKLSDVSDLDDIHIIHKESDQFIFSRNNKQNIVPIYGTDQ